MEVLISMAIMGILMAIGTSFFLDLSNNQSLEAETSSLLSQIEKARMNSLNSKNNSEFGVKFASSTATLFEGIVYDAWDASNEVYTLGSKTEIYAINLSGGATSIYFEKITGKPSATGTVVLKLKSAATQKSIIIHGSGLSEVQ